MRLRVDVPVLLVGLAFVGFAVALHFAWPNKPDPCGSLDLARGPLPARCFASRQAFGSYLWPAVVAALALAVVAAGLVGRRR